METSKTKSHLDSRLAIKTGPVPALGQTLLEKEIPSDPALVTPLVVRSVELLLRESVIRPQEESKITLCLDEALQNAVRHGNKKDFKKKVKLTIFVGEAEWGCVVSDEGAGFDPLRVRNPLQEDGLWGETGRGLYLMTHYMDRVEYYNSGTTLLIAKKL